MLGLYNKAMMLSHSAARSHRMAVTVSAQLSRSLATVASPSLFPDEPQQPRLVTSTVPGMYSRVLYPQLAR